MPAIYSLAKNPVIVQKKYADAFDETNLEEVLESNTIKEIDIIGMMTQNCVLFTAMSEKSKKYNVNIIADCCTSVTSCSSCCSHARAIKNRKNTFAVKISHRLQIDTRDRRMFLSLL